MVRKTIISGGIGPKVICVVTNDELDALPIKGTDNGDGTASLTTNSSMAVLPDTVSGDLADINAASASINDKLPVLVGGKIPVDASVSVDSINIGDVDIKEFPAGNLGQQLKAASLSVAPATDIVDATYIGDIKFGEELPAGTQLVGKVGIDQTTPGTTNLVNVNGGASQTTDIKVTLDSETIAVTGPLTDAQLSAQSLAKDSSLTNILNKIIAEPSTAAKQDLIITALGLIATEATAGNIETATEALAALISSGALKVSMATLPDTSTGSLFNMAIDINTMQPDIAAAKSDIGTMKTDIATAKADISAMKADIAAIRAILES